MRKAYSTDLSDNERTRLRSCLPHLSKTVRPRTHHLREIFDTIFYVLRSGCSWRLLPHDFPPRQTVYYHLRRFRLSGLWQLMLKVLRTAERKRVEKDPHVSAAIMDFQSVKTEEDSAQISGYEAHKKVKGRKRHLLVDTLGLPLSVYVTPADVQDRPGAHFLLAGLKPLAPRLKRIRADGAYANEELARWCEETGGWELEFVERDGRTKVSRSCPSGG